MELEKAKGIAEKLNPSVQLEFAIEPVIVIASKRFPLDGVETRFWAKVEKKDNDCWLWLGAKNRDGYGHFKIGNRVISAHRIAYVLKVGSIPTGVSILHSCDNRACVRSDHLFMGTQLNNVTDMMRKGRGNKASGERNASRLYPGIHRWGPSHALRLHPDRHARGERVGIAKLTTEQVIEIRTQWHQGKSQHALAREFDMSLSGIHQIVLNRTWRHLL